MAPEKISYHYLIDTLFLLSLKNAEAHTPVFMLANCQGMMLERGKSYQFKNLPLVCNNDTLPVWALYEAELTLFCGRGEFSPADNLDDETVAALNDELKNSCYMPDWLWQKYFGDRLNKSAILNWSNELGKKIEQRGLRKSGNIHGWWYHWCQLKTFSDSISEEEIAVLAPDFRDGGPPRIIILPENVYKKDRYSFHDGGAVISVSDDPQIIEGRYKPSDSSWECIRKWIIKNQNILLDDTCYSSDLEDESE